MSDNEKKKAKFRRSNKWKNFRRELKRKQKTDPVTGSKLSTTAVCHHLSLKAEEYEMVSEDRQVMLNPQTHDCLHYLYGDGDRRYDWKARLEALKELCERMDRLNS
jgi:hypothetical protein